MKRRAWIWISLPDHNGIVDMALLLQMCREGPGSSSVPRSTATAIPGVDTFGSKQADKATFSNAIKQQMDNLKALGKQTQWWHLDELLLLLDMSAAISRFAVPPNMTDHC